MPKKRPKAELEDLDVREVSIVDRPAIQRRFLYVKFDDTSTEESMATNRPLPAAEAREQIAKQDEDASFIDILGLPNSDASADGDKGDEGDKGEGDKGDLEEIEKVQAGQALRSATGSLEKLMGAVNWAKQAGDKPLGPPQIATIKDVASNLDKLAGQISKAKGKDEDEDEEKNKAKGKGKDEDEEEKNKAKGKGKDEDEEEKNKDEGGGILQKLTGAMERLMSIVSRLKQADASSEVQSKEGTELKAVATTLTSMTSAPAPQEQRKDEGDALNLLEGVEVFKSSKDEEDPLIVMVNKAGAKMARMRLSQFGKALDTLNSIYTELKGDEGGDKKTEKRDGAGHDPEVLATVKKLAEDFASFQKDAGEKLDGLGTRVEKIETIRPSGNSEDPPDKVKKGGDEDEGLWTSVFRGADAGQQ